MSMQEDWGILHWRKNRKSSQMGQCNNCPMEIRFVTFLKLEIHEVVVIIAVDHYSLITCFRYCSIMMCSLQRDIVIVITLNSKI